MFSLTERARELNSSEQRTRARALALGVRTHALFLVYRASSSIYTPYVHMGILVVCITHKPIVGEIYKQIHLANPHTIWYSRLIGFKDQTKNDAKRIAPYTMHTQVKYTTKPNNHHTHHKQQRICADIWL